MYPHKQPQLCLKMLCLNIITASGACCSVWGRGDKKLKTLELQRVQLIKNMAEVCCVREEYHSSKEMAKGR